MADLPQAVIAHISPGRVRLRVPAKKQDGGFFSELENRLAPLPGVERVEVNALTGSVLVLHHLHLASREDFDRLTAASQMGGLFTLAPYHMNQSAVPDTPRMSLGRSWAMSLASLNDQVKVSTGGIVDVPTLAIVGLVAVSIRQMRQGIVFIPAITALWYASSLLQDQLQDTHAGGHPLTTRG